MRKSSRKSAKVFHEKDATRIAEKVCVLKKPVGGWWEEKVDLTPCNCDAFWSNFLSSGAFVRFPKV